MCVGVCLITVEQASAACICKGVLNTVVISNADLDVAKKFTEKKVVCAVEKDLNDKKHQKRRLSVLVEKSCKA